MASPGVPGQLTGFDLISYYLAITDDEHKFSFNSVSRYFVSIYNKSSSLLNAVQTQQHFKYEWLRLLLNFCSWTKDNCRIQLWRGRRLH
jgi:hypothetical protein